MSKGIVVIGATFVDIKGYPEGKYVPAGRNAGTVCEVHGGVSRNVAEDIANVELRPTFVSVVDNSGISTDVINKLNDYSVAPKAPVRNFEQQLSGRNSSALR